MRRKASNTDVRKVFKDLGIDPADPRTGGFPMPMSPWPRSAAPVVYRTTLSNGTGNVARPTAVVACCHRSCGGYADEPVADCGWAIFGPFR